MLIQYKKPNILTIGSFRLVPGKNDIPQQIWDEAVKLYPNVKRLIDDGVIMTFDKNGNERDDESPGKPALEATDLPKLQVKKAVKLIKETFDESLLMKWYELDQRAEISKAIEAQLEEIAKAAEPEGKRDE